MSFIISNKLPRSVSAIAFARGASLLGDEIALLALLFRAKAQFGHWGVAAVLIAGTAPLVLVAPFAGLLVDRVRIRPVLLVTTTVQFVTCATLAILGPGASIALIAVLAAATTVVTTSWQVLIPTLVTDEQLPRAMGLTQSMSALGGLLGPIAGGVLYATVGFRGSIAVDAGTFLALLAVPLLVRADRIPGPTRTPGGDGILSGWTIVRRDPVVRSLVVSIALVVLCFGVVNVVEIFFTTSVLHAGARAYGFLGFCLGAGMLVTAGATRSIDRRFPRSERVFVFGLVALAGLLGLFATCRHMWQAAIVVFFLGAINSIVNVTANVLLVRSTEAMEHLRGRIFATLSATTGTCQILSMALGGLLLTIWSPQTIMLGGALAALLVLSTTFRPVLRGVVATSPPVGGVVASGDVLDDRRERT